jgi:EmrB/QacA subfamily drug resistance transporter
VTSRRTAIGALIATSLALFMVTLDNLVVTTALPVIRTDLGASLSQLEWLVNAYTLSFAAFLLTGAALGDRLGRRRVFVVGLVVFTASSALAALAPTAGWLVTARAIQGLGGAMVMPLSLTLLADAVDESRRGLALGIWSGVSGLAVALGPVVGGAVVDGASWQWIFWLNVPIGLIVAPLAYRVLRESHGPDARLDLPGLALAGGGLTALVWGLVRANDLGWASPGILAAFAAALALGVGFVVREQRTDAPMVPLRLFRSRQFTATNGVSLAMSFGIFGSIFLLAQFFQTAQGLSPLEAGLRTLPWTGMPMIVAPIAGLLVDRIGPRPLMATGLALQSIALVWIAAVTTPDVAYTSLIIPFGLAGAGMALVFPPVASAVLGAVRAEEQGKASGVNSTVREVGGSLGIAVLAAVFAAKGSYGSPQAFTDGMIPAVGVGAAVLAAGVGFALLVPGRRCRKSVPTATLAAEGAAA